MESKRFWIIIAVLAVAFTGIVTLNNKDKAEEAGSVAGKSSQNYYGQMDSPVTITEFVDFQCEGCYAYYPTVKAIKEKYKDSVRFQVRNFPISSGHQYAVQAARSAEAAARQDKFWEMHDKLFEGQKVWERAGDPQTYFDQYAEEIGLDMAKFETDRKSSDVNSVINADLKDIKELGGSGTPSFVVNGKLINTPQNNIEALSDMIDKAIKDAGQE